MAQPEFKDTGGTTHAQPPPERLIGKPVSDHQRPGKDEAVGASEFATVSIIGHREKQAERSMA
jgi:hypothetical protein